MIQIDENNTLELIRTFFEERNMKIVHIFLFGSRGRGDYQDDSDYDILIVIREEILPVERRMIISDLYRFLTDRQAMLPMDLVLKSLSVFEDQKDMPGSLAYNVQRESITLL